MPSISYGVILLAGLVCNRLSICRWWIWCWENHQKSSDSFSAVKEFTEKIQLLELRLVSLIKFSSDITWDLTRKKTSYVCVSDRAQKMSITLKWWPHLLEVSCWWIWVHQFLIHDLVWYFRLLLTFWGDSQGGWFDSKWDIFSLLYGNDTLTISITFWRSTCPHVIHISLLRQCSIHSKFKAICSYLKSQTYNTLISPMIYPSISIFYP